MPNSDAKSILSGILASSLLLGVYFAVLSLVSGWGFAQDQFSDFWYFIVSLALGFGVQIGLYVYLRGLIREKHGSGKVLGVTGTTSCNDDFLLYSLPCKSAPHFRHCRYCDICRPVSG